MELTNVELVLAVLVVALGTAIQAAIGFGLAMVAAPLLMLLNRSFVPGPMIAAALILVLWMAYRERHAIELGNFKAALLGRFIGVPPAAAAMGMMSAAGFDILFGILVLMAVLISLARGDAIRASPKAVFLAAIASGFMSTISSIGGPPIALVYQHAKGPRLRANLSAYFALGCVISLVALSLVGKFGSQDLFPTLVLILGVMGGLVMAGPVRAFLDGRSIRPYLLGLCCLSALLVLGRAWLFT